MTPHTNALLRSYAQHHRDRRLPWRRPREPLVRVAMVEGLLALAPVAVVGRVYDQVFRDVDEPSSWLGLSEFERLQRVEPLGDSRQVIESVDGIARAMIDGVTLWPAALERYFGLDSYSAGMIGLLFGAEAAPVDTSVERVGRRAAFDGNPARWVRDLVRASVGCGHSHTGRAPAYEVVCAVLDVGATRCRPEAVACHRCPLGGLCASRRHLDTQASMDLPDPVPTSISRWGHLELRAINVTMPDWVPRSVVVEAGWIDDVDGHDHNSVDTEVRVALGKRWCNSETGELDLRGTATASVAQQIADLLPGTDPWCRVVVDRGAGTITAWGFVE